LKRIQSGSDSNGVLIHIESINVCTTLTKLVEEKAIEATDFEDPSATPFVKHQLLMRPSQLTPEEVAALSILFVCSVISKVRHWRLSRSRLELLRATVLTDEHIKVC
jgi:hypothetical protein